MWSSTIRFEAAGIQLEVTANEPIEGVENLEAGLADFGVDPTTSVEARVIDGDANALLLEFAEAVTASQIFDQSDLSHFIGRTGIEADSTGRVGALFETISQFPTAPPHSAPDAVESIFAVLNTTAAERSALLAIYAGGVVLTTSGARLVVSLLEARLQPLAEAKGKAAADGARQAAAAKLEKQEREERGY